MMFTPTNSVLACASVFLALAAQTSAHAIPNPALGVKGTPQRSDVQRPSTAQPCGSINPATTIDTSTAVPVAADGTVTMQVQNFNAGADGSTSVSVEVDQTGVGKTFKAGTVTTNGNKAPTKVESDKVVFTLPAGTKCAGGKAKNLCLVSVKTTAGFGACMVVSQGAATAAAPPAKAAPPPAAKTTAKAAPPPAVKTTAKVTTTKKAATTTKAATKAVTTAAKSTEIPCNNAVPAKVTTTAKAATATKAATTAKAATTTQAAVKAVTTTAKSNQVACNNAVAAKATSAAAGKKHHHHKGKGKGKKAGAKATRSELIEADEIARAIEVLEAELERRTSQ